MGEPAIKVIPASAIPEGPRELIHEKSGRVVGDGRAIFVAKLREYADLIERKELDGAYACWCETHGLNFDDDGIAVSALETVTITPKSDPEWINGAVKRRVTVVEEVAYGK